MSSPDGDYEVINGGCQCSLVRYRVVLPKEGLEGDGRAERDGGDDGRRRPGVYATHW